MAGGVNDRIVARVVARVQSKPAAAESKVREAAEQDPTVPLDEEIGDLDIAEYIVFLLALDTYMRYLHEATGTVGDDPLVHHGINLVRLSDRQHAAAMQSFMDGHLPSETHKKMLAKAFRFVPSKDGLARRALQLRTLLSRGGAATARAIFKTNKALQEVRTAIQASTIDDADAALDKFAVITMKNTRLRKWIRAAADTAGSGTFQNPIVAGTKQATDDHGPLLAARMKAAGTDPTSNASADASAEHSDIILKVQHEATEAAKRAMDVSGEPDQPPTKSEVIGIATAAAVAAASDPTKTTNVPQSLQSLDPEQRDAALTDGRVIVASGAGSGKTTTVTSRVAYLVQERKASPSRMFVVSFNRKAARELKERIASKVGDDLLKQMNVGTMHGMFRKFVVENGSPEEKAALTTWLVTKPSKKAGDQNQRPGRAPSPGALGGFMARIWKECFNEDPPRGTSNVVQGWQMNDITPEKAKEQATNTESQNQAEWYAWTLGFKGVNKSWEPPCVRSNPKAAKQWGDFLSKWRDNGRARLGDFTDMILLFRDLLKRDPSVRKKVQAMFDHIIVDEAQDLNAVQHQIISMMGGNIGDGSDGKSLWFVGDEVQSINRFVGARPELFTQFDGKVETLEDGRVVAWKTKSIKTNYRCLPEIVEHANTLMQSHERGIPMDAIPDPSKPRGQASIVVQQPSTHATGALNVISQIKQDVDAGAPLDDYAVLTRTNLEINDYETSCIIQGIPYARKGSTSFLRSPETVTVMSYFNLAVGQDFARMQKSLAEVFNKPNRFYLKAGEAERIVTEAVEKRARRMGISSNNVNPLDLFDRDGMNDFLDAMDPRRSWENWKVRATREELENLGQSLQGLRRSVDEGKTVDREGNEKPYSTQSLFGDILNIKGVPERRGDAPPALRDVLMPAVGGHEEESDAPPDPDDDESKKPIGNVAFLYQIAQPDPANPDTDPSDPKKFKARIDKLVTASKDLRVDLDQWDAEQQKLPPSDRKAPPCVVLSTIHSVKGAQWNNTTVVMAAGVFPYEPRKKPGEEMLSPEAQERLEKERHEERRTERQLAYVAMTRAAKNLTIVGPLKSAYGRDSGPSVFVSEAGLMPGQNVAGKNDPTPETPTASTVLSNFFSTKEEWSPEEEAHPTYDRSES